MCAISFLIWLKKRDERILCGVVLARWNTRVIVGTLSRAIDNFLAMWVFMAALVYLLPNGGSTIVDVWLKLNGEPKLETLTKIALKEAELKAAKELAVTARESSSEAGNAASSDSVAGKPTVAGKAAASDSVAGKATPFDSELEARNISAAIVSAKLPILKYISIVPMYTLRFTGMVCFIGSLPFGSNIAECLSCSLC